MNLTYIVNYGDEARRLVHRVKACEPAAIREMAEAMAAKVPAGTLIVPMPSHDGKRNHSLLLAFEICRICGATVWTALAGSARKSQYETKKAGGLLKGDELGFRLTAPLSELDMSGILKDNILLIDDVIGTGETAKAALRLLPKAGVLAYAMDKAVYQKHNPQNSTI